MKKIIALGVAFSPAIAFAQIAAGVGDSSKLLNWMSDALNVASGLLLAAAVVFFLYNAFKFVSSGGDEEGKSKARKGLIQGIIGIAVMVSVWGLVNFFTRSAGLSNQALPPPALPAF